MFASSNLDSRSFLLEPDLVRPGSPEGRGLSSGPRRAASDPSTQDFNFIASAARRAAGGRIPGNRARRGAEEGGRGTLWDLSPGGAHASASHSTRQRSAPRSHPASGALLCVAPIPAQRRADPCSAPRRSSLITAFKIQAVSASSISLITSASLRPVRAGT